MIHPETQRPILQFIAIKRRDSGIWALPGVSLWKKSPHFVGLICLPLLSFTLKICPLQKVIRLFYCLCVQGMVDPGEKVNTTLRREFSEEAMNSLQSSREQKKQIEENIANLFSKGEEVSKINLGLEPSSMTHFFHSPSHVCNGLVP